MNAAWIVTKDDLSGMTLTSDDTILTEDLYQAVNGAYTIDCGWYSGSDKGSAARFITYLIKNAEWDHPILCLETFTIADAQWSVNSFKEYCRSRGIR